MRCARESLAWKQARGKTDRFLGREAGRRLEGGWRERERRGFGQALFRSTGHERKRSIVVIGKMHVAAQGRCRSCFVFYFLAFEGLFICSYLVRVRVPRVYVDVTGRFWLLRAGLEVRMEM